MAGKTETRRNTIYQILRSKTEDSALTVSQIHELLEAQGFKETDRTIRRDLDLLSTTHGLCSTEGESVTKYFISKDFQFTHNLKLKSDTLQVLSLALENLKATSHNYFFQLATDAENTILANLPEETVKELMEMKKHFHYNYGSSGKPCDSSSEDMKKIFRAISEGKIITCKNDSPYRDIKYNQKKRTFAPLSFILSSSHPYLIAKDMDDNKMKRLRVTRLSELVVTDKGHSTPIPTKKELDSAFGAYGGIDQETCELEIICEEQVATYFREKIVHPSQEIQETEDGNYSISMKCALSHELIRLISSFGGNIHSVYPEDAWEQVKAIWESGLSRAA